MDFTYVEDFEGVGKFIENLTCGNIISLDVETTSLDIFSAELLLVQCKINNHIFIFDAKKLESRTIKYIVELIQDSSKLVLGHNIKYDIKILYRYTDTLLTNIYDTMLAEILITAGIGQKFYSLNYLTEKYCNIKLDKDTRDSFINFEELTQEMLIYSALDVEYLEAIRDFQLSQIRELKIEKVLDLENRLSPVIASMEYNGIILNKEKWLRLTVDAEKRVKKLEDELKNELTKKIISNNGHKNALELAKFLYIPVKTKKLKVILINITDLDSIFNYIKDNFNLNSPKQVLNLLRNVYKVNIINTNAKTLNKHISTSFIKRLIEYRELAKRVSSFGSGFIDKINPVTNRIHTEYDQLGTKSGRISSRNPNLQNIIGESEYRNSFEASVGCKIIGVDYDQQELRFTARYSGDEVLTKSFINNEDVHMTTAINLFEKDKKDISVDERKTGKTLNFAVGYGSSEWGLYKNFNIPLKEGRLYIHKYYNTIYTTLRDWKKILGARIWEIGYSITPFGRKRFFNIPKVYDSSKEYEKFRARIEREGINHVPQGGSADCTKIAMCEIFYTNPFGNSLKLLLQVHDEIVAEVKEDIAEEAKKFMEDIMVDVESRFLDYIPSAVSGYIADSWQK